MKAFFSVVFAFYIFNLLDIDKKGEIALFRHSLAFCTQLGKFGSAPHREKKEKNEELLLLRDGPFLAPPVIFSPRKGKLIERKSQKLIR